MVDSCKRMQQSRSYRNLERWRLMRQLGALYQWYGQAGNSMPRLTKPQAKVLSSFQLRDSYNEAMRSQCRRRGPARSGQARYRRAEASTLPCQPEDRLAQCCKALASWVIGSLRSDGLIVLQVDETSLRERLKVMAVSFAYRGRATYLWLGGATLKSSGPWDR